ncbi:MAG: type VI secretion system tip protein TssI/VgrG [Methylococcaceae bacterium]
MSATQENREIEFITPLGKDVLLLRAMTVTEELGRLFTINLELNSDKNIKFEDLLGQNVTIRLEVASGTRFFNGHVSSISQSLNSGRYCVYQVTVHPKIWFLTRRSNCRIFQKKTVLDIVKEIFEKLDYTDVEVTKLSGPYRTLEYCVQYRETDFNFVSRLLEQEGIYYYFVHEKDKHTLILADSYTSHSLIPGYKEIPFNPTNNMAEQEESISSWYLSKQIQPGAYALNEYDYINPKADLKVNSSISQGHNECEHEIYDYPGEYVNSDEGTHYARTHIEELHAQYEQVQGNSIVRGLTCGGLFKLSEYTREDQNREYLLCSITHNIQTAGFEAGVGGGTNYTNSFTAIDSKTPFRPSRITPKPFVQGPQTAVVVGKSGDEIYTDEHGRVKVQFHWDRYGNRDQNSSCWIRVSQVHAGKGFGAVDIPRIGEEVIVSFEEGDPDRPIVTGRVYNGDNKAPNGLPEQQMVSGLQSNSTPGGGGNNAIMLNDTKGKEKIAIHGQYDMGTTVGNDQSNKIGNNRTTHVGVDDTQSVGSNRHVDIGSNLKETIASNRTVDIGSNLKESISSNLTSFVGGKQNKTIGGKQSEIVGASSTISVGGRRMETVAGGHTFNNPKMGMNVGGKYKVNAGGSITESSPKVSMQASSKLSATSNGPLNVKAGSVIKQESGGAFNVKSGGALNQQSSGAFNIKADGALKQQGAKINLKGPTKVVGETKITGETKIKGTTLVVS